MPWLRKAILMIRRDGKKPPNLVTVVRILLAVPVVCLALLPGTLGWIGFGCYVLAVATDWVDGYLAKMNDGRWMSDLGKYLDPLADKVINLAALAVLMIRLDDEKLQGLVIAATIIILVREVIVTWAKSKQPPTSASEAGRFAMAALVVAITLLLAPIALPFLLLFGAMLFGLGASCGAGWAYARAPRNM